MKTSRFLVLRYSFENSSRISTTRGKEIAEDSDSSTSSTPEQLFSGLDLGEGPLSRLKTLVDRFLIRGTRTPIDWLLDLRSYGMNIARKMTTTGQLEWEGESLTYGSTISFSISDFRSFTHGLLTATRGILYKDLLFENSTSNRNIPEIPWSRIYDNPIDSTPFSSFLSDPRTQLGIENPEKFLFNRIRSSPDLASRFSLSGPEFTWNTRKLRDWFGITRSYLEKLLVLSHLTGGGPARFLELVSIQYSNSTTTSLRNIFGENGLLFFVTYYHKGYSISNSTKIIHRYLPREVSKLFVYYLWLVIPFMSRISLKVFRKPLSQYLFENPTKKRKSKAMKFTSQQFRTILRRETLAGLGISINPSEYRYIAIRIARRYLSKSLGFQAEDETNIDDENDPDYEDDVIDLQVAHGSREAGLVYGRGLLEATGEVLSLKKKCQEASLVSYSIF